MVFVFDFEDAKGNDITGFENFLGMIDAFVAKFRDMNQTFKVTRQVQFGKGAKIGQTSDFTFNQLTDLKIFDLFIPGVCL